MAETNEPSVADILASIKRVLAEDGAQGAAPRPSASPAPAGSPEVLELTEPAAPADIGEQAGTPLVDEDKARSMRASLDALATIAEPGAAPQIVRSGETSLEQLVRELLRPMLKDWLDAHLPPLVESMVAREIERIARKG